MGSATFSSGGEQCLELLKLDEKQADIRFQAVIAASPHSSAAAWNRDSPGSAGACAAWLQHGRGRTPPLLEAQTADCGRAQGETPDTKCHRSHGSMSWIQRV